MQEVPEDVWIYFLDLRDGSLCRMISTDRYWRTELDRRRYYRSDRVVPPLFLLARSRGDAREIVSRVMSGEASRLVEFGIWQRPTRRRRYEDPDQAS